LLSRCSGCLEKHVFVYIVAGLPQSDLGMDQEKVRTYINLRLDFSKSTRWRIY
jgi:hypothetical protein